jgi:ABC-type transport system substrate-binding protein
VTTHIALTSLDPADETQADSIARGTVSALLFDTLVAVDAHGRLHPSLATSWQADPGNQRWTFVLRRDVKFHYGSALTPDTVAASLRVTNPSWKILTDANCVIIERDSPAPELPAELARSRNAIVKRDGNILSGTGAFRVSSFSPAKQLTLAANEDSWSGRPYLDHIEVDFGKNGRDQLINLEAGRSDIAEVSADQTARASVGARRVLSSLPIELIALVFLRDAQSQDDHNLRSALALSIDRDSIRRVILQSAGDSTAALLPNWISGYAFLFPATQNLALARQKRSEVRQPPGWTFAYDASDPFTQLVAERIVLNARDAGLTLQTTSSATADLRLLRIPLDSADPTLALDQITSRLGLQAPKSPPVSSAALYQAESAALQTQRVIPLFDLAASYARSPQIRNLTLTLTGTLQLADVWLGAPAP